jgi:hypothetical protein
MNIYPIKTQFFQGTKVKLYFDFFIIQKNKKKMYLYVTGCVFNAI